MGYQPPTKNDQVMLKHKEHILMKFYAEDSEVDMQGDIGYDTEDEGEFTEDELTEGEYTEGECTEDEDEKVKYFFIFFTIYIIYVNVKPADGRFLGAPTKLQQKTKNKAQRK